MSPTTTLVELLLLLLIAASVVALITSRLRIPYTAALVFAGIGIDLFRTQISTVLSAVGTAPGNFDILTPDVVFTLILPGLLFESSLHLKLGEVRENIGSILALAVAGVVIATLVTGYGVAWTTGLPAGSAMVFGALISATDPISVVALFRSMGLPSRLTLLIEGESLFNDGTAIVLFQVLLAALRPGQSAGGEAVLRFVVITGGGLALGVVVGYVASTLTSYVDEPRIEITLTTIAAYGAYLAAEHLHVSGVIATVATGLVVGNLGATRGMSPRTRVALFGFWEYFAFVINSLLFLLIGIAVHVSDLAGAWHSIAVATGAVIVGRVVTVYGLTPVSNRFSPPIPGRWRPVLVWGGLHGGVSIALALGLPRDLPGHGLILNMAFGVAAFSIVVQGGTMGLLVRWLRLRPQRNDTYEHFKAEQLAVSAAKDELEALVAQRVISRRLYEEMKVDLDRRGETVEDAIGRAQQATPGVVEHERRIARLRLALAERSSVEQAVNAGIVSAQAAEDTLQRAAGRIDEERVRLERGDSSAGPDPRNSS